MPDLSIDFRQKKFSVIFKSTTISYIFECMPNSHTEEVQVHYILDCCFDGYKRKEQLPCLLPSLNSDPQGYITPPTSSVCIPQWVKQL